MKATILLSIAAVALLGACTEGNQKYRHDAIRYHNDHVRDNKAGAYGRQNIDAPAPWQNKRVDVPGVTDRGVVYPKHR